MVTWRLFMEAIIALSDLLFQLGLWPRSKDFPEFPQMHGEKSVPQGLALIAAA
jgi:hypothetical protein